MNKLNFLGTVTIQAGGGFNRTSVNDVDLGDHRLEAIRLPSTWTASNLSLETSYSVGNKYRRAGYVLTAAAKLVEATGGAKVFTPDMVGREVSLYSTDTDVVNADGSGAVLYWRDVIASVSADNASAILTATVTVADRNSTTNILVIEDDFKVVNDYLDSLALIYGTTGADKQVAVDKLLTQAAGNRVRLTSVNNQASKAVIELYGRKGY